MMADAASAPGGAVLSDEQVERHLVELLPAWRLADGSIRRSIRTGGWKATLMVTNTIGHLAETAWHHPELQLSYARVDIGLNTHDAGGITAKDLALAAQIEAVLMWRPGCASPAVFEGTPDEPAHRYIDYD